MQNMPYIFPLTPDQPPFKGGSAVNCRPLRTLTVSQVVTHLTPAHQSSPGGLVWPHHTRDPCGTKVNRFTQVAKLLAMSTAKPMADSKKYIGKSCSRKLRWVTYYTLYRMDPQKSY